MRAVGANRLPALIRGAVIHPYTKEMAQALELRLHLIWCAPPELAVEEPRKRRNLIATAGLSGRASSEASKRLFNELNEIPIFAPGDLAELRADQLQISSELGEPNRLLGQLLKRQGARKTLVRVRIHQSICRSWGALQLA